MGRVIRRDSTDRNRPQGSTYSHISIHSMTSYISESGVIAHSITASAK